MGSEGVRLNMNDNDTGSEGYLQMIIDGQVVFMRKSDCMINATQILKLSTLTQNEQDYKIKALKYKQKLPARGTRGRKNTWVSIHQGKTLCVELGLEKKLQPLLDYGVRLDTNDNDTGGERVLPPSNNAFTADRLTVANEPEKLPFIEIIYNSRPLVIRKSDWRINCMSITNQIAGTSIEPKLVPDLRDSAYDFVQGSSEHQGAYVDFYDGIELCNKHGLHSLAVQLLELKRMENESVAEVQQNHTTTLVLENSVDEPHAVLVTPRLANSYHIQSPIVAGKSSSKHPPEPEDFTVAGDTRTSKSEGSEEDDDSYKEDDESSVDTNVTQLHALQLNESDEEVSLRQPKDDVDVAYINIGWTYKAAFDLAAQRVGIGPNIYPSCLPTWENVLGRRGIRKYSS